MNKFYTFLIFLFPFVALSNSQSLIDSSYVVLQSFETKDSLYVNELNTIAYHFLYVNLDSAKKHAYNCIDISEEINYTSGKSDAYRTLGNAELIQGHFEKSKSFFSEGLKHAKNRQRVVLNNMLAASNLYLESFDSALEFLLESVSLLEKVNDSSISAHTYFYLAMTYEYQNKFDKAIDYYQKTLVIKKGLSDYKGMGNTYSNLGNCYIKNENYDSALIYTLQAKIIFEDLKISNKIATSLTNLAAIYSGQNKLDKAKKTLHEVLLLLDKDKSKYVYSSTLHALAVVQRKTNKLNLAKKYANESLTLAVITDSPDLILKNYELLSDLYKMQGDFSKAYYFSNVRNQLKDSVDKINNDQLVEEMQARFENEEKEKEIVLLSQENQIQGLTISKTKLTRNITFLGAIGLIIIFLVLLNRFKIKKKANVLLEEKNKIIEIQQKRIVDSITYAKRIQESIFLPEAEIKKHFSDLFIYYTPKDIVSGDFYWFSNIDGKSIIAAADCTGHGVPGAFMSMMGHSILNDIVNSQKITNPARILERLHKAVNSNLRQHLGNEQAQDGMDVTICTIDHLENSLTFAGANNNALLVKNNEVHKMKGCFKGIGGNFIFKNERGLERVFENKHYQVEKGDLIYMYSDGYMDQFGGEKRKKFSSKKFRELITAYHLLPMAEQKTKISAIMHKWMSGYEQIDDQMIIGIKV